MSAPIADDPSANNLSADDSLPGHPLLAIEGSLQDLDAAARLLGHMATTGLEIGGAELAAIQTMVDKVHDDIEHLWTLAYEQQRADEAAHEAALAAAKAEKAAPGSVDDVKKVEALWNVLRALANTALQACDKAEEEQA